MQFQWFATNSVKQHILQQLWRKHQQKNLLGYSRITSGNYSLLESIILNREVQFVVGMMKKLNELLEIQTKLLIVYYPQIDRQIERINQELEQYLRIFINHRQKQQLDWLETVEFVYNNKIHSATKMFPFKINYGQDLRIEFEGRRRERFEVVEKFVERIKKIQKKEKVVLEKAQKEIRKYANKK